MRLGIFAKTFPGTSPAGVLAQARAAGFAAVQYNMACSGLPSMPDDIPRDVAAAVSRAADDVGVAVAAVSGTYNMIHPDPAVRQRGLARLEVLARAAPLLGTSMITLCTGTRDAQDQWRHHPDNDSTAAWNDLLLEMGKAIHIAETYGVDLGVEPELANVVNSAVKARRLLDQVASPRLKIVLDPANLFEVETPDRRRDIVAAAIDLLADRIALGHAKDRTATGGFIAAGQGVLDFHHYVTRLAAAGFTGALVTHGLEAGDAGSVARFLGQVLTHCGAGTPT